MTTTSATSSTTSPAAQSDRTARHLHMLQSLAELGMQYAEELHATRHAGAAEPGQPPQAPANVPAFARIANSIRQAIALEARLADAQTEVDTRNRRIAQKNILRLDMVDAIAAHPDTSNANYLRLQLEERLAARDFQDDLAHRALDELTTRLCRDLKVKPLEALAHPAGIQTHGPSPLASPPRATAAPHYGRAAAAPPT